MIGPFHFDVEWASEEAIASVVLLENANIQVVSEHWANLLWPEYDWRVIEHLLPEENAGIRSVHGVVHPDSLASSKLVVRIEYRATGPNPLCTMAFANGPTGSTATAIDHPDGNGWKVIKFGGVRNAAGDPFGDAVDQFIFDIRDIEVRLVRIADGGPLGDVNLDQTVDFADVSVVVGNFGATGVTSEQGDANADGVVDANDVSQVLSDMPE